MTDEFSRSGFGSNSLSTTIKCEPYRSTLQSVFPDDVLRDYPPSVLVAQVTHFCRCGAQPAANFAIPGIADYIVPLAVLPYRFVTEIGAVVPDTKGIYSEWWGTVTADGNRLVSGSTDVHQPNTCSTSRQTSDLFPTYSVRFLRQFCVIKLTSGKFQADYLVFSGIHDGQRVLHGLRDMYPWNCIEGLARLPEHHVASEAKKLNVYDRRQLMKPIYHLLSAYHAEKVMVVLETHSDCGFHIYGDFVQSPTPSAIFMVGESEITQDRVVFIATGTEIDKFFQSCSSPISPHIR